MNTLTLNLPHWDARRAGKAKDPKVLFESLVAQDWERFRRYAYRLCNGNKDDAEDLLSETLIDVYRAFDRYRGETFDRWFFRMMATNCIDMVRRRKSHRAESLDTAFLGSDGSLQQQEIAAPEPSVEQQVLAGTFSQDIEEGLAALPTNLRSVLLLCDLEGMEYEAIAETLHIPIGTVRSRIHRARARMRQHLQAYPTQDKQRYPA